MMPPLRHYDFQTGVWTKRAIRKLGTDEDREEAARIARQAVDDPDHQRELQNWLLAKPSRLRQLQRDREAARRVDEFELRSTRKAFTMNRPEHLRAVVKQAAPLPPCASGSPATATATASASMN
jgi:hypothetical protein